MSPSPDWPHQVGSGNLGFYLKLHVDIKGLGQTLAAPYDIKLALKTVVQPDVMVFLYRDGETRRTVDLAALFARIPNLVIEILSPGTSKHDRVLKYQAYARAGIKEYWIMDPKKQNITMHVLNEGSYHPAGVFIVVQFVSSYVVHDLPVTVRQFFWGEE
jgi:Uma2 family endonuclease